MRGRALILIALAAVLILGYWAVRGGAPVAFGPSRAASAVSSTYVYYPEADARTVSNQPDDHFGSDPALGVERTGIIALMVEYSYLRFNLANIPTDAIISSAELQLHLSQTSGDAPYTVEVYGVQQSWTETKITWSNQPLADVLFDTQTLSPDAGYKSWTLTSLVQQWVNGSRSNHGVVLVPKPDNRFGLSFNSREAQDNRPQLLVTYSLPGTATATPGSPTPTTTSMPS